MKICSFFLISNNNILKIYFEIFGTNVFSIFWRSTALNYKGSTWHLQEEVRDKNDFIPHFQST